MIRQIKRLLLKPRTFCLGMKDGYQECWYLSMGITYRLHCLNNIYDQGVNLGQRLGRTAEFPGHIWHRYIAYLWETEPGQNNYE